MIVLTFRCGHVEEFAPAAVPDRPTCSACGDKRIVNVKAPRPTFRGVGSGPCVVGTLEKT